MKINRLIVFIIVYFVWRSSPALPGDFAYVLKFQESGPDCLVQFDLKNNMSSKEITLPKDKAFNNFVVDEKGGCYISNLRLGEGYFRDIYYYDPEKDAIERLIDLGDKFGPATLLLTDKELIAEITGNDRTREHSGVLFIDRATKKITSSIFLFEDDPHYGQANINRMFFDGKNNLFLTTFYLFKEKDLAEFINTEYTGDIVVIDVEKKQIAKIICIDRKYKNITGICNIGDKIYVAAQSKGNLDGTWHKHPNDELLVFSLEKGELIKTIKISPHPYDIIYDRSEGKLYITHASDKERRDNVEVIDPRTDRIIKEIKIPSQRMFSVVAPGKMFITVGKGFLQEANTPPKLLIMDTKTDKIIKQFTGEYTGISVNPRY